MTLAARLTETGAAVIFAFGERLPGGAGYRMHLRGPQFPIEGTLENVPRPSTGRSRR